MKKFTVTLLFHIASIVAVLGAVFLAYNYIKGWGWLILAAVLLHPSYKRLNENPGN